MRFLFGIFIGAALTMLIATATDAPTYPILGKAAQLWEQLIDGTSNRLFQPPTQLSANSPADLRVDKEPSAADKEPSAAYKEPSAAYKGPSADKEPSAAYKEPSSAYLDPATPLVNEDPAITVPQVLPETPASPGIVADTVPAESESAPESTMMPLLPDENVAVIAGDDASASLDNVAHVWVPFRSEKSANGFASSLSRHFAYPFSVHRDGPGAYQVTFNYADTEQRESMLLNIAELTGQ
jgi:hypothetical protein